MTLLEAIIMGIVQGLTEFLPISSSGHLSFMKYILKINMDTGLLFDVLLHLGTLIAIFIAFWKDIKQLFIDVLALLGDLIWNGVQWVKHRGKGERICYRKIISTSERKFVLMIIISTIPTAILGLLFEKFIESAVTSMLVPGMFLLLTGVLLIMADRYPTGDKTEETATYKDAVFLGFSQGVATIPGLSRSGTTITAALSRKFDQGFAVRYSFIMSIPAVLGALVLEIKDVFCETITRTEVCNYVVGMSVAAVVGFYCIKSMLVLVREKKFTYFSVYCFIIGIIAIIGNFLMT